MQNKKDDAVALSFVVATVIQHIMMRYQLKTSLIAQIRASDEGRSIYYVELLFVLVTVTIQCVTG